MLAGCGTLQRKKLEHGHDSASADVKITLSSQSRAILRAASGIDRSVAAAQNVNCRRRPNILGGWEYNTRGWINLAKELHRPRDVRVKLSINIVTQSCVWNHNRYHPLWHIRNSCWAIGGCLECVTKSRFVFIVRLLAVDSRNSLDRERQKKREKEKKSVVLVVFQRIVPNVDVQRWFRKTVWFWAPAIGWVEYIAWFVLCQWEIFWFSPG